MKPQVNTSWIYFGLSSNFVCETDCLIVPTEQNLIALELHLRFIQNSPSFSFHYFEGIPKNWVTYM